MPSGEINKRSVDKLRPGAADIYLWDDGRREGPVQGFYIQDVRRSRKWLERSDHTVTL
jgi:hypothetical protein